MGRLAVCPAVSWMCYCLVLTAQLHEKWQCLESAVKSGPVAQVRKGHWEALPFQVRNSVYIGVTQGKCRLKAHEVLWIVLVVLGFELWVLHLLDKGSTT
jgi:hypothetical protein